MAMKHTIAALILILGLTSCGPNIQMRSSLYSIRADHQLPAIAALVIKDGKVVANEVVGTTRINGRIATRKDSKWHLDACARPMTVTLLAMLVDEGKLSWDTKVIDIFPEFKPAVHAGNLQLTLRQLIANRSGLAENLPRSLTWDVIHAMKEPLTERRLNVCYEALKQDPYFGEESIFRRSRLDYVVAGAIAEKVTGIPYETLMQERIFKPLGMTSARFGTQNYEGGESQPMPHQESRGGLFSIDSGKFADLPDTYNPSGGIHMTLEDWAKFVSFQMETPESPKLLSIQMMRELQQPSWDYDWGSHFKKRDWAKGYVSVQVGSNGLNFAAIRVAPNIDFAILIVSNAGNAEAAVNTAYIELMKIYMPGVIVRPD
jgi:CubicO group peptidase (beta-lactamase class C family)